MLQRWRRLLFLHWEVAPESLRPLVPGELSLDTFEGRAFVGLIPFTVRGARPWGAPALPVVSRFHETNVRTYVRRDGEPGVWFFSLDAASRLAVVGARAVYKLPYHFARMSVRRVGGGLRYRSERRWPRPLPGRAEVRCSPGEPLGRARVGSLEHFLIERYVLFAASRRGLYRARVGHRPYPLRGARVERVEETLLVAGGGGGGGGPPLAHYSPGVDVAIFAPERLGEAGCAGAPRRL